MLTGEEFVTASRARGLELETIRKEYDEPESVERLRHYNEMGRLADQRIASALIVIGWYKDRLSTAHEERA